MSTLTSQSTAGELQRLLSTGGAKDFGTAPDNELPEVSWQTIGLPRTGEVAIVLSVGELKFGAKTAAPEEMRFGLGSESLDVAMKLSESLWGAHEVEVRQEVIRLRGLSEMTGPSLPNQSE